MWVALVIAYFAVQFTLRLHSAAGLEFDEAEALWYARSLQFGYNAQPPLYFWLQNLVFHLPLAPLTALALLKTMIFAAAVLAIFAIFRQIDTKAAPAAMLSLGLLPEVVWEMQRDRTHTVLLLLLAAFGMLRILQSQQKHRETGGETGGASLGAILGLGLLSKPNFGFFALGLLVASRRVLRRPTASQILLAAAVALGIAAPWLIWAMTHPDLAGSSLHKLALAAENPFRRRLTGLGNFALALLAMLGLAALVLGPIWARVRPGPITQDGARIILQTAFASVLLFLLAVLVSGASQTQSRWLLPMVFLLPPVVTLHLHQRMSPASAKRMTACLALPWLVVLIALPLANRTATRQMDFAALDATLPQGMATASTQTLLLGNLVNLGTDRPLYLLAKGAAAPASGTDVLLLDTEAGLAFARTLGYGLSKDSLRSLTVIDGTRTRPLWTAIATAP
ncbi:glycosyltransferase family 39 protein [Paragemmobacter aquarius]|uniref:glycosyltransferase family 39 protein n=1 Tax=Paragemmobacter aquarius TaxID=2169400 RepID=UPI001C1FC994|nr:glycosyltransferase family 39 protein [Gemmobacter aquarius]